ncbi:MAG: aminotransferase class I/II-fold pyridoxal phosphate-dependent enzyme [Acidimicrobiales bacterium]|nr:aminotransferase class I/II-fold pyridoxal phosphate-dependent enzyme [Acidimicrobiales bacterium]
MSGDRHGRILLSPPEVGEAEEEAVLRALRSGWIAPAGPELDAFERELAARCGRDHAVALSSGTAALHLILLALGVGPGDTVLVSTLTFVASVNPIRYVGAEPVLIDAEPDRWNIDPSLVADELADRGRRGRPPAAVVAVDLYGRCCDYSALEAVCAEHEVPLVVDAAESLGANHEGPDGVVRPAGQAGVAAVLSFNGNKIITTSGGGAVVTDDEALSDRVRHLATQAREPAAHYEHRDLGYNYRLSNLLAALGRAQLSSLDERVAGRRKVAMRYEESLGPLDGVSFPATDPGWNGWLTCLLLDPRAGLPDPESVRSELDATGIEARRAWKPMHRQPLYAEAATRLSGVADQVFDRGLCLPSSHALSTAEVDRVIDALTAALG